MNEPRTMMDACGESTRYGVAARMSLPRLRISAANVHEHRVSEIIASSSICMSDAVQSFLLATR